MNSYGFSPGVMIDPVTMNPMVRGGSITVNPMGVPVPVQQKPWLKFALMNIHEDMPDDLIKKLIGSLGKVVAFNRLQNQKTKVKSNYCIFQYSCGEDVVRISKFFKDVKVIDRVLDLKISQDTKNFLKQWMNIQKEEWKKKQNTYGSSEVKDYASLDEYLERDDKAIQDRFNNTLKDVNNQFRRVLQSKQRDDERKEHPKQKERDKKKRQLKDELEKKYSQKLDYWLMREKEKDREYKKDMEREKDRQKLKLRRLEREMELDEEEQKRRIAKFLTSQRRAIRQKELQNDLQKIQLEWLPPEPELLAQVLAPEGEAPQDVTNEMEQHNRIVSIHQQQLHPSTQVQVSDLMQLDNSEVDKKQKAIAPNVDKTFIQTQVVEKPKPVTLNLPSLDNQQKKPDQSKQQELKRKQQQLFKLYKQIPRNKEGLWCYKIDWEAFTSGNVFDRKIRPWLFKTCAKLLGEAEQKFIAAIEKLILKKATPDHIVKVLTPVFEKQTDKFVMDLWVEIIFSILKVTNELEQF